MAAGLLIIGYIFLIRYMKDNQLYQLYQIVNPYMPMCMNIDRLR